MLQYNITFREKDKGWQYIISYKVANKWKQKAKQGFKTKALAKIAAEKALEELKTNNPNKVLTGYEDITFNQIKEIYLDHCKLYKEIGTVTNIRINLDDFSYLDNKKIKDINTLDLQMCFDKLVKRGLKASTIKVKRGSLLTLLTFIKTNYNLSIKADLNKVVIKVDKVTNEKKALTKQQLEMLFDATRKAKHRLIFMLAGTCGLRAGEILGLTWDCIDFKDAELTVDKQWKAIGGSVYGFGTLKSKNSYRTVPISQKTLTALIEYKTSTPTNFDNRLFNYASNISMANAINRALKSTGANISIHELRHTYATMLISNGTDFKTTAELLGHDIQQTMSTYSHVTSDMRKKAINTINAIF